MDPSYRILLKTALDLQSAMLMAVFDAAARGIEAASSARPVAGMGRIGALSFLAQLDFVRGKRRQPP